VLSLILAGKVSLDLAIKSIAIEFKAFKSCKKFHLQQILIGQMF